MEMKQGTENFEFHNSGKGKNDLLIVNPFRSGNPGKTERSKECRVYAKEGKFSFTKNLDRNSKTSPRFTECIKKSIADGKGRRGRSIPYGFT